VSGTTASEAKRILAERGVITKHGTMYYVASDWYGTTASV
jgi:hypothetical protein